MTGPDQMVYDVGGGSVSTSAAKPLTAGQAANDTARVMDSTVAEKGISGMII